MSGVPLLDVDHASISYNSDRGVVRAVVDASFTVHEGEFVVLLGPSGCGKSTLLKAIASLLPCSGGEIRLHGRGVSKPDPDRALVFQEFDQLLPWKRVKENITFALKVTGRANGDTDAIVREHLTMVGLEKVADRYPHELSGGMKQRVAIARGMALRPKILLMDEPFGSLDAQTRRVMQEELARLWQSTQMTIIFVTHSVPEAVRLGSKIIVMATNPGRIKEVVPNEDARSSGPFSDVAVQRQAEITAMIDADAHRQAIAAD